MSAVAVRNFSRCLEAMQSISEIIMGVFFKKRAWFGRNIGGRSHFIEQSFEKMRSHEKDTCQHLKKSETLI